MATRVDAANELDALKAQLADFALRHAAETIARDPKRFLSSDLMKAIEQSAIAAVEARLAREPRLSAEDIAEQVLAHIRPELSAAIAGAAGEAPRVVRPRSETNDLGDGPWDGLARELRRHWATLIVVFILIAAAGGSIGYVAGLGVGKAEARRPPAPTPLSESVPLDAAAADPKTAAPPAAAPASTGAAARPAPAAPVGSARSPQ